MKTGIYYNPKTLEMIYVYDKFVRGDGIKVYSNYCTVIGINEPYIFPKHKFKQYYGHYKYLGEV